MMLFWRQGYEATGIAEITAELGIGRQSLYGTFGDKRALFLASLDHYRSQVMTCVLTELRAEGSALANVRRVLDLWESSAASGDGCGCFLINSASELGLREEELTKPLRQLLETLEDAFATALQRAIDEGELRADVEPRGLARGLLAIGHGLSVTAKVRKNRRFARDVIAGARLLLDASLAD
ncbi:MAG: TetR/AcrR family transcriptional regulator [Acidobacteriota bacterium]